MTVDGVAVSGAAFLEGPLGSVFDRRTYRLGFAPLLAVMVLLAFSVEGTPPPFEPAPGTIEFDSEAAEAAARELIKRAPSRTPGSEDDHEAADLVRDRFELSSRGTVAEQTFEAKMNGDNVELRNVLLTLPAPSDRAIVVIAPRDSRGGLGAPSSAAATGALLAMASGLAVSDRDRTMIFASIDGLSASGEGIDRMLGALPERLDVETVVVIFQPGFTAPFEPHLLASSTNERSPSAGLISTAEAILDERAQAGAGMDGPLGQIARLALPAASGSESALNADGVDAIAISSAGAVPLPPGLTGAEHFSAETLERFGAATLAVIAAFDAAPAPPAHGPETYIRFGENLVPGWTLGLLALALLAAPAMVAVTELARARRRGGGAGATLGWAAEWVLVGVAPLVLLYALALIGLIPRPAPPFDPGRFGIGPLEVLAMLLLIGAAAATWWILGLRRAPAGAEPLTLGAAATLVVVGACLVAWLANPVLALLLVPTAHVVAAHADPARARAVALPALILALVPLAAAVAHVGSTLGWGETMPWQLVLLVSGGTLGLVPAVAIGVVLAGLAGLVTSALARRRVRPGASPTPGASAQGPTPESI